MCNRRCETCVVIIVGISLQPWCAKEWTAVLTESVLVTTRTHSFASVPRTSQGSYVTCRSLYALHCCVILMEIVCSH